MKSKSPFRDLECMRPTTEGGERFVAVATEIIDACLCDVKADGQIVNCTLGARLNWLARRNQQLPLTYEPTARPRRARAGATTNTPVKPVD